MLGLDRVGRRSGRCMVSPSTRPRKAPQAIMMKTPATKTYVGMAKSLPDSFMPAQVHQREQDDHADRAAAPCARRRTGTAEPRFSTPEAIDTATVRT